MGQKGIIMGLRFSVPVLPGVHVLGPQNKPVRPWHWAAAIAALVVVAGCASGEGSPAETTSSGAYTTTPPPLSPPPPAPAQAQSAASQCNPHYSGACVPIDRGDVNCAGGTGNGPEYVQGPVYVVGQDIYGLDATAMGSAASRPSSTQVWRPSPPRGLRAGQPRAASDDDADAVTTT